MRVMTGVGRRDETPTKLEPLRGKIHRFGLKPVILSFNKTPFPPTFSGIFIPRIFLKKNLLVIYDGCESKLTSKFWKMFSNEADDDEGAQTPSEKSLEPKESVHSSLLRLHFPNNANRK